jgi:broad specificity phosphatase PhoE
MPRLAEKQRAEINSVAQSSAAKAAISAPLQIYLIRHGETEWSRTGKHTSHTDVPLTPNGEAMARQLATRLKDTHFSLVLTSPRLRARATCELAGLSNAQIEANLAEWNYGQVEGLRSSEISQSHPEWSLWQHGSPGGETPAEVCARADQLIVRLIECSGNVALFSHGHFGRVLAARWIGLPVSVGQCFALDPASISILGFEPHHPQRRVISCWNT